MQSSIISCSCDGYAGGFGTYGDHTTLLAVDSVRCLCSNVEARLQLATHPPSACLLLPPRHRPSKTAQRKPVVVGMSRPGWSS